MRRRRWWDERFRRYLRHGSNTRGASSLSDVHVSQPWVINLSGTQSEADSHDSYIPTSGLKRQDNDLIVIESAEAAGRHSSARSMRDLSVVRLYRLARSTRTASASFEMAEKCAPISSSIHELNCSAS